MRIEFPAHFRKFLWASTVPWIVLAGLLGCARWATKPGEPGIDAWEYRQHCGACHKLPKPKSKNDEEWREFILDHRLVTGQDEETAQLFVDYLRSAN